MLCPVCRRNQLPERHVPGRDGLGRPLCDPCLEVQLRASAIAHRILDSIRRQITPRVLDFRRGH